MISPLPEELAQLKAQLLAEGQEHVFDCDARTAQLRLQELFHFESYPGGVVQYLRNARKLLHPSSASGSSEGEYTAVTDAPLLLRPPSLLEWSDALADLERRGCELLEHTAFVLVAGGLGERLGFRGIKTSLPVETATGTTFLEHFFDCFVSWRASPPASSTAAGATSASDALPFFVIMTSDDTHEATMDAVKRLEERFDAQHPHSRDHSFLGRDILIVKQETVFCLSDATGRLAIDEVTGHFLRKPHGHGDVHALLHHAQVGTGKERLIDCWERHGIEYLVFCQDTNNTATWTAPVSLACMEAESMDMLFTCVPRVPEESVGLLCHVQSSKTKSWQTVNVEYNKFDPMYRALYGVGDVAAANSPYSPFPGSINTLLFRFSSYAATLRRSGGAVPEFINPKFKDAAKTQFKAPSRVESLMQDLALLLQVAPLPAEAERARASQYRVGGIVFERILYHPVKNSVPEALAKLAVGGDAHCAASGEENVYVLHRRRLKALGVQLLGEEQQEQQNAAHLLPQRIPIDPLSGSNVAPHASVQLFPVIALDDVFHSFNTLSGLRKRFPFPEHVRISPRSVLVVRGNVIIESLDLDGAVEIRGSPTEDISSAHGGGPLVVRNLCVVNAGWGVKPVSRLFTSPSDSTLHETDYVRGFVFVRKETLLVTADDKGSIVLTTNPEGPTNAGEQRVDRPTSSL